MSRRRKKLPKQPIETDIDIFSHELKGISRINGKATFIQGGLPGEKVSFQYTLKKKNYDEGIVTDVISPSKQRVEPRCKHYTMCGGCSLQHLDSKAQILQKQQVLIEQLENIGKTSPLEVLPPLTARSWEYRNKARLSVRYVEKKNSVLVGFRERNNGRFITDIDSCEVLTPKIGKQISELRHFIATLKGFRSIAQVEVAASDSQCVLIFRHLEPLEDNDLSLLQAFGQEYGFVIYLQPAGPDSVHKLWPVQEEEWLEYSLPSFDLTLRFHPCDFTQVNSELNCKMIDKAMALLDPQSHEKILDLFCGLGNFSLPLAKLSKQVVGVEGSSQMVERASMNARLNYLENTQFFAADLTKPLEGDWVHDNYDKLLIDPPRSGALEIVEQIKKFNVDTLLYISCNPATLARDAAILTQEKGYCLSKAGVMDMFPQTSHVESIALFERK